MHAIDEKSAIRKEEDEREERKEKEKTKEKNEKIPTTHLKVLPRNWKKGLACACTCKDFFSFQIANSVSGKKEYKNESGERRKILHSFSRNKNSSVSVYGVPFSSS